jgi:hypothetical protein
MGAPMAPLIFLTSPHSMASEWVKTEIAKARRKEIEEKQRVLPRSAG